MLKKINYISTNRKIYKNIILKTIYENFLTTRKNIANLTGINIPTVYNIVSDLLKNGLITQTGYDKSNGGRKSDFLSINSSIGYVIGVGVEQNYINVILTDFCGNIKIRKKIDYETKENEIKTQYILDKLIECINYVLLESKKYKYKIFGIGIGIPGIIDKTRTTGIFNVHISDWHNISFKEIIYKKFKLPVFIENKNNLAALAETRYHKIYKDLIYLNVDTGVGIGIIIEGKIYTGFNGTSGEFGHIIVSNNGRTCICGNNGCIESFISIPSIISQLKESISQGVYTILPSKFGFEEILNAFYSKDKLVLNTINNVAKFLSIGVLNLINIFNPGIIVIGGRIIEFGNYLLNLVNQNVSSLMWEGNKRNIPEILFSKLGFDNQALGAAEFVISNSLNKI